MKPTLCGFSLLIMKIATLGKINEAIIFHAHNEYMYFLSKIKEKVRSSRLQAVLNI